MTDGKLLCPRCFFDAPLRPGVRFCPHCGLRDPLDAAADTSPLDVTSGGRTYEVLDRIAVGSLCTVYRCRFSFGQPLPLSDTEIRIALASASSLTVIVGSLI